MANDIALTLLIQASNLASPVLNQVASSFGPIVTAAVIAGAATVGFLSASVNAAGTFQQAMLKNAALAGLSQQAYVDMSNQILQLSPQIGQAPTQLAQGLYFVLSAGVPAANAMDVLKLSAEAAATGMTDTKTVADGLTSAMNAFSIPWSQATNVMAALTQTVTSGKMEWSNLANVIGIVSVTAHESGIAFTQAAAGLATLTDSGLSAQRASMDLDFLMRDVGVNASKVAASAKGMGLAFDLTSFQSMSLFDKLTYLQTITKGNQAEMLKLTGGAAGFAAAEIILAQHGDLYNSILGKITASYKAGDATQKAFAITQQGLKQQLDQLGAAWQVLLIVVGTKLLPVLTDLVRVAIIPLVNGITALVKNGGAIVDFFQQDSIWADAFKFALLSLGLAVGVWLVTLLPGLIAGFIGLAASAWAAAAGVIAATWPFILIGAAIAALVVLVVKLYQNWTPFRNLVNATVADLQQLWNWLSPKIGAAFSALGTTMKTQVLPALQQFWSWIQTQAIPALQQFWNWLSPKIGAAFSALGTFIQSQVIPALQSFWSFVQTKIVPAMQAFWTGINNVATAMQNLWKFIQTQLQPVFTFLGNFIQATLVPALHDLWNTIQTELVPAFQNIWNVIQTQLIPTIQQLWNWFNAQILPIFQQLWTQIQTQIIPVFQQLWSIFQTQILPVLTQLWNQIQTQVIPVFQQLWTQLQPLLVLLAGPLLVAVLLFIAALTALVVVLTLVAKALTVVINIMQWLGTQLGLLIANVVIFTTNTQQKLQGWSTAVGGFFNNVGTAIQNVINLLNNAMNLANSVGNAISGALGGFGGGITVPGFASGVENFGGGLAYVHQGEVLMNLAPGTSVTPASRVSFNNTSNSGGNVYITAVGSTKEQIQQISDALDKKWGKNYRRQYGPVANGGGTL